ncbi:MAG: S9 family peptidase [Deltaproteobacteria bacterium]|nr:S9 family peptidase [Deltaproteobacteria bacterium]
MRSLVASVSLLVLGCAPPNKATPYPKTEVPDAGGTATPEPEPDTAPQASGVVHYFDREVDLEPFLVGFPYGRFRPSLKTKALFYFALGDAYTLKMLPLAQPGARWDLAVGKTISDVDWSKRSLWSIHHHAQSNSLWLHADASNDEKMNLWRLSLDDGKLEQVTDHDYVYGLGFSEDGTLLAYLPRSGTKAPFRSCLRVREVASGNEREILCDDAALTFTWSDLHFSPDNKEVYFNAQTKGDRNREQLVRVALDAAKPKLQLVTNARARRSHLEVLDGWVGDELVYVANDDGFANLYAWSRKTRRTRALSKFTEDISSAELTARGVVAVHRTPAGSTLAVIDPVGGKTLSEQRLPGSADVIDGFGDRALVTQESPDILLEGVELGLDAIASGKPPGATVVVAPDEALQRKVVACKAERVSIPTFDVDPKTRKPRELHAFLLTPRTPLADAGQRLAMITSFYGGDNAYSEFDQIMCAAGLTVLSPSVRGSSGFGRDFAALNDRDLGGDEIVDLFHVARWLEQRTGLDARHIGVYGGSHGGYATMRALTFPPATNGRNEFYAFGFGLAHAGFSDIESFHDKCNIPDWVVLESGDPKVPADRTRMHDRSPLTHVERLRMPILLTHGSNDWRVPVQESRQFADKAKALDLPVYYVEFEGQGHRIEGLALQKQLFQTRFDFLMAVVKAAAKDAAGAGADAASEPAAKP